MSDPITLKLGLEERRADRVFISVLLAPEEDAAAIGGVAVELRTRTGESLSPRLLLPIAGALQQPMISSVELRSVTPIPVGSRVVSTAWWQGGQVEATCPTDPWTEMEAHMRGGRLETSADDGRELHTLDVAERQAIAALFPWVDDPMIPVQPIAVLESSAGHDTEEQVDDFATEHHLDDECAQWLKDLMAEDE